MPRYRVTLHRNVVEKAIVTVNTIEDEPSHSEIYDLANEIADRYDSNIQEKRKWYALDIEEADKTMYMDDIEEID